MIIPNKVPYCWFLNYIVWLTLVLGSFGPSFSSVVHMLMSSVGKIYVKKYCSWNVCIPKFIFLALICIFISIFQVNKDWLMKHRKH